MTEKQIEKPIEEQVADNREDFMRRWFAIAISVGFATTVVNMPWVKSGGTPSITEWNQICRLLAALFATVLSWEGYLLSIKKKRLYEFPRYFIDIILVFLYLFLLLTSGYDRFWLKLHAITFGLYIFWDFLTAYWHREWYDADGMRLWLVYWFSFLGRGGVDRGLAITWYWALYFCWLWVVSWADFYFETPILASFVIIGLFCYRANKGKKFRKTGWYSPLVPLTLCVILSGAIIIIQRFAPLEF